MNERVGVIERAAASYRALADLAEAIEDEWQYITDLTDAYLPSIRALGDGGPLSESQIAAANEAIAEIELIADPHKAIDWLSTFPHILALALGGEVDSPAGEGLPGEGEGPDSDDDSPFRILLGGNR